MNLQGIGLPIYLAGNITTGLSKIERELLSFSGRVQILARDFGATTAGITRFKDESVAAFSSWESAFAEVKKTVDVADLPGGFDRLSRSIRDMALEIPFAVEEIAKVASIGGQLGIPAKSIEKFTKVILDMGVTTDMTTDEAATGMARLATIMKIPTDQFENLGSAINLLGSRGAATESEIVNMSLRMGAMGSKIGLLPHQILALSESLSSVGVQAELGGGTMTRMFSSMDEAVKSGGKKLDAFNRIAGTDFKAALKKDAQGAIELLVRGLNRMDAAGENSAAALKDAGLKGSGFTQVITGLQQASAKLSTSFNTGAEGWSQSGLLAAEAAKRYETFEKQTQLIKNSLHDIKIDIGEALVPIMMKLNMQILNVVGIWKKLDKEQKTTVIYTMAIVSSIPPLLMGLGKIARIGALFTQTFGQAFTVIKNTLGLMGLFNPVVLGIVAVGAAIAGVIYYFEGPGGFIAIWDSTKMAAMNFWDSTLGFIANFKENMTILWDWLKANWLISLNAVAQVFVNTVTTFPQNFWVSLETLMRLWATFSGWFAGTLKRLWQSAFVQNLIAKIGDGLGNAWTAFTGWITQVQAAFARMLTSIGEMMIEFAPMFTQLLIGSMTGNVPMIQNAMIGIGAKVGEKLADELNTAGEFLKRERDMLINDAAMAAEDPNLLNSVGRVLDEQARKFVKPWEGVDFPKGPEFNLKRLTMASEEAVKPSEDAAKAIATVAEESGTAADEVDRLYRSMKGVEGVAQGSAEAIWALYSNPLLGGHVGGSGQRTVAGSVGTSIADPRSAPVMPVTLPPEVGMPAYMGASSQTGWDVTSNSSQTGWEISPASSPMPAGDTLAAESIDVLEQIRDNTDSKGERYLVAEPLGL